MKFKDLIDLAGYLTNGDLDKAMDLDVVIVPQFTKDGPILISPRPGAIKNIKDGSIILTVMPEDIAEKEVERSQKNGEGHFISTNPGEVVN